MHAFQQKDFDVDCDGVVEYLMSTIQEQVKSYQNNTKSTRKLLRKHLSMPLYYAITNGDATKLPLTSSSIQRGNVHDNFLTFLEKRKNKTQKEEPRDDDLMDTDLVVQQMFYLPRGKREAILKKTTRDSASEENTALSQSSASGSDRTTRPCWLKKRQTDVMEINGMFAGVNPDVFSKQKKKKRGKEATLEELAETSFSNGLNAAEVGTLARNDTPPRNNESCVVTPSTTRRKSDSTMDPVLTQVKSVTIKNYH
jgi:hypothetical protein